MLGPALSSASMILEASFHYHFRYLSPGDCPFQVLFRHLEINLKRLWGKEADRTQNSSRNAKNGENL